MGAPRLLMMRNSLHNNGNVKNNSSSSSSSSSNIFSKPEKVKRSTSSSLLTGHQNYHPKNHPRLSFFSRKGASSPASISTSSTTSTSTTSTATAAVQDANVESPSSENNFIGNEYNDENSESMVANINNSSSSNSKNSNNNNAQLTTTKKTKRSIHLSIITSSSDADSECVQINLEEEKEEEEEDRNTKVDMGHHHAHEGERGGCGGTREGMNQEKNDGSGGKEEEGEEEVSMIYSVGSVDYVVKHGCCSSYTTAKSTSSTTNTSSTMQKSGVNGIVGGVTVPATFENPVNKWGGEGDDDDDDDDDVAHYREAMAGGERDNGRKSKFGSFLKSSGKKGGSDANDDNNINNNNQDKKGNNNNGGDSNDKNDNNGGGGDNNNNNNSNNSNNPRTPAPQTIFPPERHQFAQQCTIPLHPHTVTSAPKSHPSWTPASGTDFKVRCGPNYPKNGKKEQSLESLYEVYDVRFFRSQKRTVGGATRIMPLPEVDPRMMKKDEGVTTAEGVAGDEAGTSGESSTPHDYATNFACPELKGTKIPDVLVVHFMLPYEPPNMFKQKDDGPGGECVYYLRPSKRFLDEISGRIPATPATLLFAKWCSECQSNLKMRSRFKCMALVRDIDKHNFGVLKTYNGKPVLITESGRVCSGYHGDVKYLEMTANVHYWAFMAKKGFVSLIPKFKNMQMEVGFTIEAHADSEMPECMLGSTVLSYISDSTGPIIPPEMQEPVHEHQS